MNNKSRVKIKEIKDKDGIIVKKIILPDPSIVMAVTVDLTCKRVSLSNTGTMCLDEISNVIDCLNVARKVIMDEIEHEKDVDRTNARSIS